MLGEDQELRFRHAEVETPLDIHLETLSGEVGIQVCNSSAERPTQKVGISELSAYR